MSIILAIIFGIYFAIGILLTGLYLTFQVAFWPGGDHLNIPKDILCILFLWPWSFK